MRKKGLVIHDGAAGEGKLAMSEKGGVWRARAANKEASVGNLQACESLISSVKCLAMGQAVALLERLSHWLLSGRFCLITALVL